MKIYGLDFTSSPSARKPVTCAVGNLRTNEPLIIDDVQTFENFLEFEMFLKSNGPWIAGIDFPFGLPLVFIHEINLKLRWEYYVQAISEWGKQKFEMEVHEFQKKRPRGKKEPRRITDSFTGAKSPLKRINPPLTKMFYEGAPRLLNSNTSIIPCRPLNSNRIVLETWPAQLAKLFSGKYKNEGREGHSPNLKKARIRIIEGISSCEMAENLGFPVKIEKGLISLLINDGKGDSLDSILCSVQAGWAWRQSNLSYGIPKENNKIIALEGWITGYGSDPKITQRSKVFPL